MDTLSRDILSYPGIFHGSRFAEPGDLYSFILTIDQVSPLVCIDKIVLLLGQHEWYWNIRSSAPYRLDGNIRLPSVTYSQTWHPEFVVEGCSITGVKKAVNLKVPMTLTATPIKPIFNASLACSNWDIDQWKIDPIRDYMSNWGINYTTLGREVNSLSPSGKGLIESENEWAKNSDCFVGVLTSRDKLLNNLSLPSAWPHAESGFAYHKNKPYLAFVENGIRIDALYRNLDEDHIVRFDPCHISNALRYSSIKMLRFREECNKYRSEKAMHEVIDVAKTTCTVVVGLAIVNYLVNK